MKYIVTILIVLLLASNIFWLYNMLDKAVSADHSHSAQAYAEETIKALLQLNGALGLGQDYESVAAKLESEFRSRLIKKKSNAIFFDSVVLVFDGGTLSSVKLLDDLSSEESDALEK